MVKGADRFWKEWSGNFPVSATHEEATEVMPKGVKISRAGQSVFLSMEELAAIVWPEEEAPTFQALHVPSQ